MILLVLLLLAPILAALVVLGAPIAAVLAVLAVPALAVLALLGLSATAAGDLSSALATLRAPTAHSLETLGIALGLLLALAALAYLIDRLVTRNQEPALRRREVVAEVRERNTAATQPRRVTSAIQQDIPAALAAQCQGLRLVPCPV